ncbi:MAG: LytTR family DNA-binding domain-containing protein [Bacteroidia bacterium]|nr:LytTR family DNA-binding domain-containing protein [Bacteroidia bacterium]
MNILIIEDEYLASKRLSELILAIRPEVEVLACLESVSESLNWLKSHGSVDLIFSDIQLSDGLSFDIFEQIQLRCPIIFTTAYDEYAIKAFKVQGIDYLMKPIKRADLQASLQKYESLKQNFSPIGFQAQMDSLLGILAPKPQNYKNRFLVEGKDQLIPISIDEISYFYTKSDIVYLIKNNGRKHSLDFKMDQLEKLLDPSEFFRLNRQFICKLNAIESINPYFNGRLIVKLSPEASEDVFVSRDKAKAFKSWLGA